MTRYKELRRMERAIAEGNKHDLEWALDWARARKRIATRKDHIRVWSKREAQILQAMDANR